MKFLYKSHKDIQTQLSFDKISRTLQSIAAIYSRVFIVVDAVDKYKVSDGCQIKFLSYIINLHANCQASLFATSRFILEIIDKFNKYMQLEIRASDEDI